MHLTEDNCCSVEHCFLNKTKIVHFQQSQRRVWLYLCFFLPLKLCCWLPSIFFLCHGYVADNHLVALANFQSKCCGQGYQERHRSYFLCINTNLSFVASLMEPYETRWVEKIYLFALSYLMS